LFLVAPLNVKGVLGIGTFFINRTASRGVCCDIFGSMEACWKRVTKDHLPAGAFNFSSIF
jgi:hypothetical protein